MSLLGRDQKWIDVTREEREFCAVLFSKILNDCNEFVDFLNKKARVLRGGPLCLPMSVGWVVGSEVALYRDLMYENLMHEGEDISEYIEKIWEDSKDPLRSARARKFDLALFSDECLVVIEAKAHGGFSSDDVSKLDKDQETIRAIDPKTRFVALGLHSCKYTPETAIEEAEVGNGFHALFTWNQLAKLYRGQRIERWMNRANRVRRL